MILDRMILPVGQGAFYCEEFRRHYKEEPCFTVAYDCGSQSGNTISRVIKSWLDDKRGKRTINAVFISHLDSDHINGLKQLLKSCNVRYLFVPIIPIEEILMVLISMNKRERSSEFIIDFIIDPVEAVRRNIGENTQIIYIASDHEVENERRSNNILRSGTDIVERVFKDSFLRSPKEYIEWKLVPYNICQEESYRALKNEFAKSKLPLGFKLDIKEIRRIFEDPAYARERKELRRVYNNIRTTLDEQSSEISSINIHSMTLFSGRDKHSTDSEMWVESLQGEKRYIKPYMRVPFEEGALYTGDYNMKNAVYYNKLYDAYHNYWENIGVIQIPHHGSRHCFNRSLLKKGRFYFISAGINNLYGHPDIRVMQEILDTVGDRCYLVTEQPGSFLIFSYQL